MPRCRLRSIFLTENDRFGASVARSRCRWLDGVCLARSCLHSFVFIETYWKLYVWSLILPPLNFPYWNLALEPLWPDPASAPFSFLKPMKNDKFGASVARSRQRSMLGASGGEILPPLHLTHGYLLKMIGLEALWPDAGSAPFSSLKPVKNDGFAASLARSRLRSICLTETYSKS